jgi:hypothetical protein
MKASALGPAGSAAVPTPLALPLRTPVPPPPHRVPTVPSNATTRIFLLFQSATYTAPVAGSTARPLGVLKRALEPTASTAPDAAADGPASGATSPPGVTMRTAWFPVSLKKMAPPAPTATPWGKFKREAVAPAFVRPGAPVPARVDTTPPGVTARSRWLKESATTNDPLGSTAEKNGEESFAAPPAPSANPREFQAPET